MRRTEADVKKELQARSARYYNHKKQINKRIVAAVICLCMIAATLAVIFATPGDEDDGNYVIQTPFDSSVTDDKSNDNSSFGGDDTEDGSVSSTEPGIESSEEGWSEGSGGEESGGFIGDGSIDASEDAESEDDNPYEDESRDDGSYDPGDIVLPPNEDIKPEYDYNLISPQMPDDGSSLNLMHTLSANKVDNNVINNPFVVAYSNFAAKLFKGCASSGENTLISPLSVMLALSMIANGADGETKEAVEKALGGIPIEYFNKCISNYVESLPSSQNASLSISNSAWIKDGFGVNEGFLQCLADYYKADAYMAPFTEKTAEELNSWIENNTDGVIKNMLERIPDKAVLLMVNALLFDAKWNSGFTIDPDQQERPFTNADGSTTDVMYLSGSCLPDYFDIDADVKYIETSTAEGIVKKYKDGYSFVALLPKDKNGLNALIASLNGNRINSMISGAKAVNLSYSFPAFAFDSGVSSQTLQKVLTEMGMGVAFNPFTADFTNINEGGVYIGEILHKTFIEVNNKGTKAGAATIIATPPSTGPGPDYVNTIRFDRPFVYMIVEDSYNTPIFMGKATDMSKSTADITFSTVEKELSERSYSGCKLDEDAVYEGDDYPNYPIDVAVLNSAEEFESYSANKALWDLKSEEIDFDRYYAVAITTREPYPTMRFDIEGIYHCQERDGTVLRIEMDSYPGSIYGYTYPGCMADYYYVILVSKYYAADRVELKMTGIRAEFEDIANDSSTVAIRYGMSTYDLGDFDTLEPLTEPVVIKSVEELNAYLETYGALLDKNGKAAAFFNRCKKDYAEGFFGGEYLVLFALNEKCYGDVNLKGVKSGGEAKLNIVVDNKVPDSDYDYNFVAMRVSRFYHAYLDGAVPEINYISWD